MTDERDDQVGEDQSGADAAGEGQGPEAGAEGAQPSPEGADQPDAGEDAAGAPPTPAESAPPVQVALEVSGPDMPRDAEPLPEGCASVVKRHLDEAMYEVDVSASKCYVRDLILCALRATRQLVTNVTATPAAEGTGGEGDGVQ